MNLSDKINEMIENAGIFEGLPYVQLKYIIEWKKDSNREKDIKDIELIYEYLSV